MGKKQNIYNGALLLALIIYNFLYRFFILKVFRNESEIITSIFFALMFIACVFMLGFSKIKLNPSKKKTTIKVGVIVVVGIALTYCIGVFVGFQKNGYSLSVVNIIKNTISPLITIVFMEFFRYNIIRANRNKFKIIIVFTALLTILEIQTSITTDIIWGLQEMFVAVTSIVIPIIAKNMVLSYLSYEVGYQPCLIYRLIFELYIFLFPYLPKFGDYLNSMFGLILPMTLFIYSSEDINEKEGLVQPEYEDKKSKIFKVPIYIFIFVLVALISRIFPIFMIGIGSESMTGAINKGDAVIAYKVGEDDIQVNDVIVFQTQDKILIHRVVEIENIDGTKYYRTKGDANGTRDNIDITIDKIYGKVNLRIPYIAYPSVWLTEFMQKHS